MKIWSPLYYILYYKYLAGSLNIIIQNCQNIPLPWALGSVCLFLVWKQADIPPCLSECRGQSGCHGKASRCLSATVMGHLKSVSTLPTALLRLPTPPAGGTVSNLVQAGEGGDGMGGKETFSAQLNWTAALLSLFSAVSKSPTSTSGNSARIFCKNKTLGEQTKLTLWEKLWFEIWCFDCYKPKLNNLSHRQAYELPEARSQ